MILVIVARVTLLSNQQAKQNWNCTSYHAKDSMYVNLNKGCILSLGRLQGSHFSDPLQPPTMPRFSKKSMWLNYAELPKYWEDWTVLPCCAFRHHILPTNETNNCHRVQPKWINMAHTWFGVKPRSNRGVGHHWNSPIGKMDGTRWQEGC